MSSTELMEKRGFNVRLSIQRLTLIAILACGLAACSGTKGDPGTSGTTGTPGPTGPSGSGTTGVPLVTTATQIKLAITGVTIAADTKATIKFTMKNELDLPLKGLSNTVPRFIIAQLRPGVGGKGSEWRAYTTRKDGTAVQATAEAANTAGAVFKDNGDGSYEYTFSKALNAYGPDGASYDANLTHRVALELRSSTAQSVASPFANAPYTFVPATGSTTVLPARRDIVDNDTCYACHDRLEFHGGPRSDTQYCVTCHNPGTTDGQAPNNTLDMPVMIHKIHSGVELTNGYKVTGNGGVVYEFGDIVYTQDRRNCQTCHQESDADTPQASNWRTVPYARACGACHDSVNFATGVGHGPLNEPATDDQCVTCHGPASTVQNGNLRVDAVHRIPEKEAAKDFKFEVVKVEAIKADGTPGATPCAAATVGCTVLPGEFPKVTIKISNPKTGTPYQFNNVAFTNTIGTTTARVRARVATTTENFVNRNSNSNPAQPIQIDFLATTAAPVGSPAASGGAPTFNATAGTYSKASTRAMPVGALGTTGEVFLEGRTIVDVNPYDAIPLPTPQKAELAVASSNGVLFPIQAGAIAVARRAIVDVKRCDDCHNVLAFHGDARNEQTELCATCHNPENASGATKAAGVPFDFKVMIHGIHAGTFKYGNIDFTAVSYPGKLNNCEGCHKPDTYYPVDPTKVFATSFARGANAASPVDDPAVSANSAICSGCHVTNTAKLHMEQNGGDFNTAGIPNKNADGTFINAVETCTLCHGPGRDADVKIKHKIGTFEFRATVAN
jgi:OmcA/MtrC family decaheme c-type cytochrome